MHPPKVLLNKQPAEDVGTPGRDQPVPAFGAALSKSEPGSSHDTPFPPAVPGRGSHRPGSLRESHPSVTPDFRKAGTGQGHSTLL